MTDYLTTRIEAENIVIQFHQTPAFDTCYACGVTELEPTPPDELTTLDGRRIIRRPMLVGAAYDQVAQCVDRIHCFGRKEGMSPRQAYFFLYGELP